MGPNIDNRAPSPLPPIGHEISRPSSASTQASNALYLNGKPNSANSVSLPGLSTLASVAVGPSPPHMRYVEQPSLFSKLFSLCHAQVGPVSTGADSICYRTFGGAGSGLNLTASPTPTSVGGHGSNPPVCQNCATSTTPLWRRDEIGSVLCNACGLFLKLHGRPRPISLKTDVIKSRNRIKSSGHAQKKKPSFLSNGAPRARSDDGTPPPAYRRVSGKSSGASDRSNSPISRANTPALHHSIAPPHMFDGGPLTDPTFGPGRSPSLPSLHFRHPSPAASIGDKHLEPPQTYDYLQQQNTTLRTKVSELEVINGLYKDRISELERNDMLHRQAHNAAQARENGLRRRLQESEREIMEMRNHSSPSNLKRELDGNATHTDSHDSPYPKRSRLSEGSEYPEP
ncbi:MAG: hypothetical protein LQ340_004828, partial [Diploschistes diacapsis]